MCRCQGSSCLRRTAPMHRRAVEAATCQQAILSPWPNAKANLCVSGIARFHSKPADWSIVTAILTGGLQCLSNAAAFVGSEVRPYDGMEYNRRATRSDSSKICFKPVCRVRLLDLSWHSRRDGQGSIEQAEPFALIGPYIRTQREPALGRARINWRIVASTTFAYSHLCGKRGRCHKAGESHFSINISPTFKAVFITIMIPTKIETCSA